MSGDCNYDIMMYNMITLHTPNLTGKAHIIQKTVIIEGFLKLKYFHSARQATGAIRLATAFAWCYKVYLF